MLRINVLALLLDSPVVAPGVLLERSSILLSQLENQLLLPSIPPTEDDDAGSSALCSLSILSEVSTFFLASSSGALSDACCPQRSDLASLTPTLSGLYHALKAAVVWRSQHQSHAVRVVRSHPPLFFFCSLTPADSDAS
jgi:hypothetical protein